MRTGPPRSETELYWKGIWEKETSHNTHAHWLVDLEEHQSHLPEEDPVKIPMTDIQEGMSLRDEELDNAGS